MALLQDQNNERKMMNSKSTVFLTILILFLTTQLFSADWPTWRGPNHNGITNETDWNPKAIEKLDKAWEINVGFGYATVSVVNGKVYTIGNKEGKDKVFCLDEKTGKEIWTFSYETEDGQYEGTRATPVYDEGKIYSISRNGQIYCFDANDGKVIWQRDLLNDYNAENITWGVASSPRILNDKLLLNINKSGIALNKKTGKDIWASPVEKFSYATPYIYTMNGKKYAAIFSSENMVGVEVESGNVVWEYPWKTSWDINGADPIFFDNQLFLSSGYKNGCALLDLTDNTPKIIWENKNISAQFGSCVLIDGYIYGPKGNCGRKTSGLSCIDAKTGELQWEVTLGFSSLIAVDNKLVITSEDGILHIAEVNPKEYKEIAQVQAVEASRKNPVWTAPVLANKRIYVRNHQGNLVSIKVD